jgi:hypothetical protein
MSEPGGGEPTPTTDNKPVPLASPPRRYRFKLDDEKNGFEALQARLQAMNATSPVAIKRPSHVLLNAEGLVQKQFRFTTTGLSQLCQALAPGLSQCVSDVAGLKKEGGEDAYDQVKAIAMLNAMINLRFRTRLRDHGLVIDRRSRRVEGLVGPRYEFFSNLELFERCEEFVKTLDPPAQFHEAIVAGRRLMLRYLSPQRLFSVSTPHGRREPYYSGWHFSNSEIGDCSVHAGVTIIRKWTGDSSFFECGKIVHVKGGRFGPKFNRLLEDLQRKARKELEENDYEAHVTNLMGQSLGLGGSSVSHAKQLEKLVGRLSRAMSKRTARQVIHRAISQGSYQADHLNIHGAPYDMLDESLARAVAGRTAYDLYNSLTHVARTLQPEQQEAVEKLAYRILMERHKLT